MKLKCGAAVTIKRLYREKNAGADQFEVTAYDPDMIFSTADDKEGLGKEFSKLYGRFYLRRRAIPQLIRLLQTAYRSKRLKS